MSLGDFPRRMPIILAILALALPGASRAYPLDGYAHSHIARLQAWNFKVHRERLKKRLPPGQLWPFEDIDLRLADHPDLEIPPVDPEFQRQIVQLLGGQRKRYAISILDLTDPERPVFAEHRGDKRFNPGSVGKLVVATALFRELALAFPDTARREEILRTTWFRADDFIHKVSHKVPLWSKKSQRVFRRKLRVGDNANLWTWLDWMLSASSNSAASMVIKQVMLLHHFGDRYPPTAREARRFFTRNPPGVLGKTLREIFDTAMTDQGLDPEEFRQGGFFTSTGKRKALAGGSRATTHALMRFLVKLEQGKIVDGFSSREIKRLLYMTQRRIRYASSPALRNSAVYFKSGSLYKCRPEPGFVCKKYHGNVKNLLNSVAIIETPPTEKAGRLYYLVVVSSNILRVNSAVAHQSLATRIHRLMESRHGGNDGASPLGIR